MQIPINPNNEVDRLALLSSLNLLETDNEVRFDRLTHLVKQCLQTDIVLISLVDDQRQWFKSKQGLDASETSRDISFCGHAILADDIFDIPDARQDVRFADNPLVIGEPYIRFYAGAPLTIQHHKIGTLCIIERQPRTLTTAEKSILRQFADAIEQEIDDRLQEQSHYRLQQREMRYRSVLEGTRIGTWEWNVQTGVTVFNERWAEITGYTLDELAPISIDTWMDLAHPDDLTESSQLLQQHFSGESEFYDCTCRMRHKLGHWVWVHDRGRVISRTQDGQPLMMYGTHADITAEKLAEQALKDSRDQFAVLVDNIPGITYRCLADADWTMLYMSGSIDPLSGYPADDFIQNSVRTYVSVIHPDDRSMLDQAINQAVTTKTSWMLQYRVLHQNGTIRYVEERGRAEYNADDTVRFLDGFILDITNEQQLRRQLLKLTEQLPGIVYQFKKWPDGRMCFPYSSASIHAIYGVTPEQARLDATSVFNVILADDLPSVLASIELSEKTLSVWQQEYRIQKDDGRVLWHFGKATPEKNADGSVLWHGYIDDITNTKHYYLALEAVNEQLNIAQQRLELSSRQAQIGYWQASLKTGELWWSPMIYELFGVDPNITQPSVALFKSTVHPDDVALLEASEEKAKVTGLHDVVHRIIRSDGQIRWVHELAQMMLAEHNPEEVMIGSVQDITERMRLQQLKDEFISTVSHELRTPLTSINAALKLLKVTQSESLSHAAKKMVDIAYSNGTRLHHLINDLLDVEKLAAGKMLFDLKSHGLLPILQKSLSDHEAYADKLQITLEMKMCDEAKAANIVIDEHRLQQILANLLSNAMKYSLPHGVVLLDVSKHDRFIEIAVCDQGKGIPDHFRERIFQRFAQADASSAREQGGTGLGLALCKELAEGMRGEIGYTSALSMGTRFFVRFPSE